jgi:two-component system chemotaxis response regulator CheY
MKSLVVEDDASNRVLLKSFLSNFGECDIVTNGEDAVKSVRDARRKRLSYDLVCMDLKLPGEMDGHEAIREIRKQEVADYAVRTVKIIVTTAHTDMDNITGALNSRCDAFLVKPVDTANLREKLLTLGLVRQQQPTPIRNTPEAPAKTRDPLAKIA